MSRNKKKCYFKHINIVLLLFLLAATSSLGLVSSIANNLGSLYHNLALSKLGTTQKNEYLMRSIHYLDMSVVANPNTSLAWRNLGYAYLSLLDEENAIAAWEQQADIPAELLSKGNIAFEQGDTEGALYWYELALKLSPEWSEGWFSLGLFYKDQQQWDLAITAFSEAVKETKRDTCVVSQGYYHLAKLLQHRVQGNDIPIAIDMLEAALKNDTFCDTELKAEVFYSLGELYMQKGYASKDIINQFSAAVRINPNHHWARLKLSYAVFREDGDWEEAVKGIQMVIAAWEKSQSPNLRWGYLFLGDVYLEAGLRQHALNAYLNALTLDENSDYILARIKKAQ